MNQEWDWEKEANEKQLDIIQEESIEYMNAGTSNEAFESEDKKIEDDNTSQNDDKDTKGMSQTIHSDHTVNNKIVSHDQNENEAHDQEENLIEYEE